MTYYYILKLINNTINIIKLKNIENNYGNVEKKKEKWYIYGKE